MIKEIRVTQHHIDTGYRQSCSFCPVALALIEELQLNNLKILVSPDYVGFYPLNSRMPSERYGRVYLSTEISSWIIKFDTWEQCNPIEFKFLIPDQLWGILKKANKVNTNG